MSTNTRILSLKREVVTTETVFFRQYVDQRKTFFLFKRIIDVLISSFIAVFVLSWLVPLCIVLIKMDSKGPVFFIQRRVGRGGRSFKCLKFRTMIVNRDANRKQAQENDSRITPIGSFLRKSNLDEFPQFLNVLIGDMSIVGPRPHMHVDCNKFSSLVPEYKFRNMVRPGITGLAQVKGYRGPTKDFESIFHRYQFDAFYIRNANILLDMRIVRQTAVQTLNSLLSRLAQPSDNTRSVYRRWAMSFRSLII
ncbi:MAG: sugar transferase [Chitinophagaceae bacterium]|nr:sugar transferase [Chitinophagaceae bacterium]